MVALAAVGVDPQEEEARVGKPGVRLNDVVTFIDFTHAFTKIERTLLLPNRSHPENDAEHSYQLTLLAWYLNQKLNQQLDTNKLIKLALVHDLVEVYAGDTWVFDAEKQISKSVREKAALERITQEFPDFTELHAEITEYETGKTDESKFIYALDKIIPILNLYIEGNGFWRQKGVTLQELVQYKTKKVARWPELVPLFNELINELKKHPEWFATENPTTLS